MFSSCRICTDRCVAHPSAIAELLVGLSLCLFEYIIQLTDRLHLATTLAQWGRKISDCTWKKWWWLSPLSHTKLLLCEVVCFHCLLCSLVSGSKWWAQVSSMVTYLRRNFTGSALYSNNQSINQGIFGVA